MGHPLPCRSESDWKTTNRFIRKAGKQKPPTPQLTSFCQISAQSADIPIG